MVTIRIQFGVNGVLGQNNYSNDKSPPASDFRICTKLRTFAVPVLRCSGILLFRCSGVPVLRCSAVPGFTIAAASLTSSVF